jgi:YD repeat-containing protein
MKSKNTASPKPLSEFIVKESFFGNGNNAKSTTRKTNTYDKQGKLTLSVAELDNDADGKIDDKKTTTNTYDKQGNLTLSVIPGGSPNRISNTYDKQGNLTLSVEEFNARGQIVKKTTTNTYDKQGNLTLSTQGDNFRIRNTYDKQGKLTRSVEESGLSNALDFKKTITNTYDKQGKLTLSVTEGDIAGNGTIDQKFITRNTYDKQGKLTLSITESDENADGKIDLTSSINNAYDKKGNLIRSIFETDLGNDGSIDRRETTTANYAPQDSLCGTTIVSGNGKSDLLTNYNPVKLVGGKGNDLVKGTNQADVLTGGGGADIFMLAAKSGFDTITDFQKGTDLIGLAKGVNFGQLSFNSDRVLLQGETLATLTGVQTSTLTPKDFINI